LTVILKATDPLRESYSGFDGTELTNDLRTNSISRVFVGGLATDYCVKNTVLDGLAQGFEVVLLLDASRAISSDPKEVEKALLTMVQRGAQTATLEEFPEPVGIPEGEPESDTIADKPLTKAYRKKKARLRSRGPYRKAQVER
jgi:hypothetical protein